MLLVAINGDYETNQFYNLLVVGVVSECHSLGYGLNLLEPKYMIKKYITSLHCPPILMYTPVEPSTIGHFIM